MAAILTLQHREVGLSEAQDDDDNIIRIQQREQATRRLHRKLAKQSATIAALVKHHLRLSYEDVIVRPPKDWITGSFNVCIPVDVVSKQRCKTVMMRFAMPHAVAEAKYRGTLNEKLRCEVGTYAWMQENCPDICIPHLYGFGLSGRHFTHENHRPWHAQLLHRLRRWLYRILRYPTLSHYTPNPSKHPLSAYLLLEHIGPDTGQMLSSTWTSHNNPSRRKNLFRSMAHLILSLGRVPQPRIGSFKMHDDCTFTLTNRPLLCSMMQMERDGAARTIKPNDTYQCTEPFVSDLLKLHDGNFLTNPANIIDERDCRSQMAAMAAHRAMAHHYISRNNRNGPFLMQFTDLHNSNIFVDDEWRITCIVDLEWICALPRDMILAPDWLTSHKVNQLRDKALVEYKHVVEEFLCEMKQAESEISTEHPITDFLMRSCTPSGWFWRVFDSVGATHAIVSEHLLPRFSAMAITQNVKTEADVSALWQENSSDVVSKKVVNRMEYENQLRALFSKSSEHKTIRM